MSKFNRFSATVRNTLPSTYEVEYSDSNIDLNPVGGSFNTLYTYSGSGLLLGTTLFFDTDEVLLRITVDGNLLFELDLEEISNRSSVSTDFEGLPRFVDFWFDDTEDVFTFRPTWPIEYSESVLIEAKSNDGSTNHDNPARSIVIVKDS